jgi:Rho GTPase-activating protein 39
VTAKLESFQDQVYSPAKHHPPLLKYSYSPVNAPLQQSTISKQEFTSAFTPYQQPHQKHPKSFSSFVLPSQPQNQQPFPSPIPIISHSLPQSANQHASSLVAAHSGQPKGFLQHFQDQLNTNSEKIAEMALIKECDIEKFAQENLNFSKGIFRKKSSVRDMLSFTSEAISKPMLSIARDKMGKKMAIDQFKLVQIYMGDRKARIGMSLNSVAMDIITQTVANSWLRDELYVQLSRQTTENPKRESLIRGWELMAICLSFVPPSPTFQPALLGYMNRHRDPSFTKHFQDIVKWPIHVQISHYATIACRRLERIGSSGKRQAKKPTDDEINQARVSSILYKTMGLIN